MFCLKCGEAIGEAVFDLYEGFCKKCYNRLKQLEALYGEQLEALYEEECEGREEEEEEKEEKGGQE